MLTRITLSAADFMVSWSILCPGAVPPVLATCLGRDVIDDAEWATLASRHEPAPELVDALTLLGNPLWAVEARLISGIRSATDATGGSMRVYAAAGHDSAVITTLADGKVTLTSSTPHHMVTDVVALTGKVDAGPGRSINVRADVFRAAAQGGAGDPYEFARLLTETGIPRGEASMLSRINTGYRRGGEFGVQHPDDDGTMAPGNGVVTFVDTANGRWAQRVNAGNDGRQWITTTPASTAELAAMVAELPRG